MFLLKIFLLIEIYVDWDKFYSGIKRRIDICIENEIIPDNMISISNDDLSDMTSEEKKAYNIIDVVFRKSIIEFSINRLKYINALKNNPYETFNEIEYFKYNCLDREMADATFYAFKLFNNAFKEFLYEVFRRTWIEQNKISEFEHDKICISKDSLEYLKKNLNTLIISYKDYPFKRMKTEAFISTIDSILCTI